MPIRAGYTLVSNAVINEELFRVYPVPASKVLNIAGMGEMAGSIELFSLTGNLVVIETLRSQLDIGHIDAGIYYLLVKDLTGHVLHTRQIIKH